MIASFFRVVLLLIFYLLLFVFVDWVVDDLLYKCVVCVVVCSIVLGLSSVFLKEIGDSLTLMLNMWIAMTLFFSCVYGMLFYSSSNSFNLKPEWFSVTSLQELDSKSSHLKQYFQHYQLCNILLINDSAAVERASTIKSETVGGMYTATVADTAIMPNNMRLVFYSLTQSNTKDYTKGVGGMPMHLQTIGMEKYDAINKHWLNMYHMSDIDYKEILSIAGAKNREQFCAAVTSLKEKLSMLIERTLKEANSIALNEAKPTLTDFVYLSFSISTTIGSTGIEANTKATKILVTIQSFLVVVYLGLLLEFIGGNIRGKVND